VTAAPVIYLVRHGATIWNDTGRYQGRMDVPLSDAGVRQVRDLAQRLRVRDVHFHAAYCSTLSRSGATAALLLEGTGRQATPLPALDELSYGTLQGLTPEARATHHAALDRQWRSTPWEVAFPEGESLADVETRVAPTWDEIVARHAGETVLVAAHGHVNRVLLIRASSLPRAEFWRINQPNASCWVVRGGLAEELGHPERSSAAHE
jgi:broad specificity phosphatase PhoE